jgi:hypothetical protein
MTENNKTEGTCGPRSKKLTDEEHRERHILLHKHLDELFADFIKNNPNMSGYTKQPILALITWSANQVDNPDHKE